LIHNIPASVHQRLLNHARSEGRPFNEVLQYYALNRFLYRLAQSSYRDCFVLKGALMIAAWDSPVTRPTRDIDLLGRLRNRPETVAEAIRTICAIESREDGLTFDATTVSAERTMGGGDYHGVRVRFAGHLGRARIPMQIDVAFGDILLPGPTTIELPSILDLPSTVLLGYTRQSAIAEKLQIMLDLGELNSRLKDYYDIWLRASRYAFSGALLAEAIQATFSRRNTPIVLPIAALHAAYASEARETQWSAFVRRNRLQEPATLAEAVQVVAAFALPVLSTIAEQEPFHGHWPPAGPWQVT
jgi:hypothetical protein